MTTQPSRPPNPKRVAAGKRNRALRKALAPEALQRLRDHALRDKPWRFSTGPTTAAGKARAAANGKKRQIGPRSVREIKSDLADLYELMHQMRASAELASKGA